MFKYKDLTNQIDVPKNVHKSNVWVLYSYLITKLHVSDYASLGTQSLLSLVLNSAMLLARENTFGDQNKSNDSTHFVYFQKLFIKIKPIKYKISNNLTLTAYCAFKQTKVSCNLCHFWVYPIGLTAFGIPRDF